MPVVAPNRAARLGRWLCLVCVAAGLVVGVVTIAVTLPRYGGGASWSGAAVGLALLSGLLGVYTAFGLAVTSRAAAVPPVTLAAGSCAGVVAGVAWCALMPFNQTLALPGPWPAAGYGLALGAVVIGAPATAAAIAIRHTADARQAAIAAAGTGGVAALVMLAGGWATVWAAPGLLDTPLLDKGPSWRPPDMVEQVVTGYLALLLVAPLLAALVGRLVAVRTGRPAAVAALAACTLLAYPALDAAAGGDGTRFGGVGTTEIVFSPTGGTLLTSNAAGTWVLWDMTGPSRRRTFNDRVVYSPDGRRLASRNVLWTLPGPARTATFDGGAPIAYDAAGTLLATHPTRTTTTLWRVTDPAHPVRLGTLEGRGGGAFTPSGATYVARDEDRVTLWDVRDPARPVRLAAIAGGGAQPLSADGTVLATGAVLWSVADPAHPRLVGALDGSPVFSPDGRTAAAGHGDGGVTLFDTATGARVATLPPTPGARNAQIGASDSLTTVAFGPDGRTLSVIVGNGTVGVWDLTDRQAPVRTRIVTRPVSGPGRVAFSPDTTVVAGAAPDGDHVTLWRLDDGNGVVR
ncbi:hypothetical protein [Dactylosporangium sp. NPDC049140]|uniref:WD40 repeat domain-containing protein n=1 Tax=Dactylosporangium sp. NPDC049140 TaxID=3155647 RepID=UPI0033DB8513